jgi:hypothetical protein
MAKATPSDDRGRPARHPHEDQRRQYWNLLVDHVPRSARTRALSNQIRRTDTSRKRTARRVCLQFVMPGLHGNEYGTQDAFHHLKASTTSPLFDVARLRGSQRFPLMSGKAPRVIFAQLRLSAKRKSGLRRPPNGGVRASVRPRSVWRSPIGTCGGAETRGQPPPQGEQLPRGGRPDQASPSGQLHQDPPSWDAAARPPPSALRPPRASPRDR